MLVLTRRVGESLNIGDEVTVIVSKISGNQVKIAVDAPKDMAITRSEIQHLFISAETKVYDS